MNNQLDKHNNKEDHGRLFQKISSKVDSITTKESAEEILISLNLEFLARGSNFEVNFWRDYLQTSQIWLEKLIIALVYYNSCSVIRKFLILRISLLKQSSSEDIYSKFQQHLQSFSLLDKDIVLELLFTQINESSLYLKHNSNIQICELFGYKYEEILKSIDHIKLERIFGNDLSRVKHFLISDTYLSYFGKIADIVKRDKLNTNRKDEILTDLEKNINDIQSFFLCDYDVLKRMINLSLLTYDENVQTDLQNIIEKLLIVKRGLLNSQESLLSNQYGMYVAFQSMSKIVSKTIEDLDKILFIMFESVLAHNNRDFFIFQLIKYAAFKKESILNYITPDLFVYLFENLTLDCKMLLQEMILTEYIERISIYHMTLLERIFIRNVRNLTPENYSRGIQIFSEFPKLLDLFMNSMSKSIGLGLSNLDLLHKSIVEDFLNIINLMGIKEFKTRIDIEAWQSLEKSLLRALEKYHSQSSSFRYILEFLNKNREHFDSIDKK